MTELPKGWSKVQLSEICSINPRIDKTALDLNSFVSFVPMPAVEAETGKIDISETRKFETVRKSYTSFQTGDVLFAKITPCMENGKMAVVPELPSTYGFGSTEFHVLRTCNGIDNNFIYYIISNRSFRFYAEHNMTGAVGQKRVPAAILEKHKISLPPTSEQRRIVNKIEALFAEIDKGVESLQAAKKAIGLYRQSLLKYAFEGSLTAEWRTWNADKLESPDTLLNRIHEECEKQYKLALEDWKQAITKWEKIDKKGKKPVKPRKLAYVDPQHILEDLKPNFPSEWDIVRLGELDLLISDGPFGSNLKTSDYTDKGVRVIRLENVGKGKFLEDKQSFISLQKYETIKKYTVLPGSIIFASFMTGTVRVCIVPDNIPLAINKADCFAISLTGVITNNKFVVYYLQTMQVFKQLENLIHGVGRPRINTTQLKELYFPLCSPTEQAEIVRILDRNLEATERVDKEIDANLARADALRQSILKKAFAGELVPQDPNDEPASALLERIRAERTDALVVKRKKRAVMKA